MFRASPKHFAAMQPTRMMFMRQSPQLYMRQTMRLRTPVPKEEHSAHTISQRLRSLRKIPAELIPLGKSGVTRGYLVVDNLMYIQHADSEFFSGFVLVVAVGFAFFSLGKKLYTDRTLRLKRQAGNN
ncbi:hypothetical protein B0J11DRAFT_580953 [Dendryphion nanum]|uniref:Uncharacterized protein n=1 Tax=Dendryphion nanum TaxID=256645 RepID=A0A9P9DPF1_9PLEO|nr:hypothetical protein B0J11DRAFT_580953 [Dendryphion nanum]